MSYYFSTSHHLENTKYLKRFGPEDWQTLDHEFGKFGYAMLNTTNEPAVKQPYQGKHGVLVWDGRIYNVTDQTKWLAKNLDNNIEHCIEVIRSLNGDFTLTWVTDDFIIFCDGIDRQSLYYFIEEEIHIASCRHALKEFPTSYKAVNGFIYIYDKHKKTCEYVINRQYNTDQTVNNWDTVHEMFELSIKDRHSDKNLYTLGGIDSGAIHCAVHKLFGSVNSATVIPNAEHAETMALRAEMHDTKFVPYDSCGPFDYRKILQEAFNHTCGDVEQKNKFANLGLSSLCTQVMPPAGLNVLVDGQGADNIFSDNGVHGKKLFNDLSVFGGYFPKHLNLVWPWAGSVENGRPLMDGIADIRNVICYYWGVRRISPLQDPRIVQAFLNTTQNLKNKRYKGWLLDYMDNHKYPYRMEKLGMVDNKEADEYDNRKQQKQVEKAKKVAWKEKKRLQHSVTVQRQLDIWKKEEEIAKKQRAEALAKQLKEQQSKQPKKVVIRDGKRYFEY